MEKKFIKKYWDEEKVWFYIEFADGQAVKQIEISPNGKKFLSNENQVDNESSLYDQKIDDLDLEESDYITKDEFNSVWESEENKNIQK